MSALLTLEDVHARYGEVRALHGVSLDVGESEVVSVLGPNGAGKTTTLRAVSGMVRTSGTIVFDGTRVGHSPEASARLGIAHVPEGRGTFPELTVWENLRLGAYTVRRPEFDRAVALFPWLARRRDQQAGTLSGGEQQMLALARALMARPRLLLLDEPSLGLAPIVVDTLADTIKELHAAGITILLVEQRVDLALRLADRGYVLETGNIVLEDKAAALLADPRVQQAYLGT